MSQLVDLCGKAIHLEDVKSFEKSVREYVFCPCFQEFEIQYEEKGRFGKTSIASRKEIRYVGKHPYGAVLSDKEKPADTDRYTITSDGGYIAAKVLNTVTKPVGNAIRIIQKKTGIDRSINMEMRIWTRGQKDSVKKWGDIPAKLRYADGRDVDVYQNSEEFWKLGNTITPSTANVPTLEVHMKDNKTLVFFGAGIDIVDVEAPYQALLNAVNALNSSAPKKRLSIPVPKILRRNSDESDEKAQLPPAQTAIPAPQTAIPAEVVTAQDENKDQ